jgi:AcrR family transcriptional regulator
VVVASSGLRASMREIAEWAGIRSGSLYHHFQSKDEIFVELIHRYHADLKRIGEIGQNRLDDSSPVSDTIVELGSAIATCAVRHRAALQMSFHETPAVDPELGAGCAAIQEAMLQTLRVGRWSGYIRPDVHLGVLSDRICQSMLHVGLVMGRHDAAAEKAARVLCRIELQGLASRTPDDATLDHSAALEAVNQVIRTWADAYDAEIQDEAGHIRSVARKEFGRSGYEVTTIRDIAFAAGVGAGTVYRNTGSKEDLLASIMRPFTERVRAGLAGIYRADATAVEKLDALCWLHINAVDQFYDEWKIQLAWTRQSPPDAPNPGLAFNSTMRDLKALLAEGIRSGELRIDSPSIEMLSRCVMDVLWMPENIVRTLGTRAALTHARDTVLRGVADRSA